MYAQEKFAVDAQAAEVHAQKKSKCTHRKKMKVHARNFFASSAQAPKVRAQQNQKRTHGGLGGGVIFVKVHARENLPWAHRPPESMYAQVTKVRAQPLQTQPRASSGQLLLRAGPG